MYSLYIICHLESLLLEFYVPFILTTSKELSDHENSTWQTFAFLFPLTLSLAIYLISTVEIALWLELFPPKSYFNSRYKING